MHETHQSSPRAEDVLQWLSNMVEGHGDIRWAKILNLDSESVFATERLARYHAAKDRFLHDISILSSAEAPKTTLNITPAFSTVHVHHDEKIVVSTVRTIKARATQTSERSIAKIWIIWPPEHIHKLPPRGPRASYGATTQSLESADGAMWFAQMDGETVVLPEDLAHATFTLESCYLIGSSYDSRLPKRASLIPTDLAAGAVERVASMRLVKNVETALALPFDQSIQFVYSFWCESAHNIPTLRCNKRGWSKLLEVFAKHMGKHQRCVSCVALGLDQSTDLMLGSRHHLEMHASNNISTRRVLRSVNARANVKRTRKARDG
jgi:hypothetical protein